jgi:phage protein D
VPVARTVDGELGYVADSRFAPLANVAVVATPGGGGELEGLFGTAGGAQCIFDGFALSHKIHLESGTANSMLTVWAQDATWLMNQTETVREWVDVTDAAVANTIFGDYGIVPADANLADDSPSHTEDGHTLMQRGSDIQFLRSLARRNGKVCRVACNDQPAVRIGYFATPALDGDPVATLTLTDLENWTVNALDIEWDATQPTAVVARQALFSDADPDGVSADTDSSGLAALAERTLGDFSGAPMTVLLAAPVDDGGELGLRARALLRDAGWFVRCEGVADVERLGLVLRAGMIVAVAGIGTLHSGRYLVWAVRHTITAAAHTMKFTLVRNAVGPAPAGLAGFGL